jgi:hypothetical protein
MTKLENIEQHVATLSKSDLKKLFKWLDEFNADLWDREIENDAVTRKFDKLISAAKTQAAAGTVRQLQGNKLAGWSAFSMSRNLTPPLA